MKGITTWLLNVIYFILLLNYTLYASSTCQLSCQVNRDCYNDTSNVVVRTLGMNDNYTCYLRNICFNTTVDNAKVPVQQYPLNILSGQDVVFKINDFQVQKFTLSVYITSYKDDFTACNTQSYNNLNYSNVASDSIRIPKLDVGIHYLIFESNHNIYSCKFGFRLQLTVYENNCGFVNGTNPCSNKGLCILNSTSNIFQCDCCNGYYKDKCAELDSCKVEKSPCSNNGVCTDVIAGFSKGYQCKCNENFEGDICDQCSDGFTGKDCTDINECNQTGNANICNYGKCFNTDGGFHCQCPANVTGIQCDKDTYNNCISSPCNGTNGTVCIDKVNGFECKCPVDFTGENCESQIDNCEEGNCNAEGTLSCVDGKGVYQCNCIPGYTGFYFIILLFYH